MSEAAAQPVDKSNKVRAMVIAMDEADIQKAMAERGVSNEDVWSDLEKSAHRKLIKPPFNLFALSLYPEKNSELGNCIDAMCTNICGFGHQLTTGEAQEVGEAPAPVEEEWERLDEFITYGDWNGQSHTFVRKLLHRDLESTGNAWLEVIETSGGDYVGYNHIPAYQMRLAVLDAGDTVYTDYRAIGRGKKRRVVEVKRRRRFRRFVQLSANGSGHKFTWFKELGDPRAISAETGEPLTPQQVAAGARVANPMVHFRLPCTRSPYGIPRYIGNMYAILGGRAAEVINYNTIRNNNIPSMLLMVSNGQLTGGTIQRIQDFTKTVVQEGHNYSKFLIIEADPDANEAKGGQVKIEAQPLSQLQKEDAMFKDYEAGNAGKVRRSFRLPDVLVGQSGDYTANNVDAAKRIADEQVFAPERMDNDWQWNRILRYNGAQHHIYRSNGPNITDDEAMIKVMAAAERSGAMTPRRATAMLEDIMGKKMPPLSTDIDLDIPFSQQMAEAVKNQANPAEVGQQVTALKQKGLSLAQLRDQLVHEVLKSAKAGALPGVLVPADKAMQLLDGHTDEILSGELIDPDGRTFYLLDQGMAVGIMKMSYAGQKGTENAYTVEDLIPISPKTWTAMGSGSGDFLDAVQVGG